MARYKVWICIAYLMVLAGCSVEYATKVAEKGYLLETQGKHRRAMCAYNRALLLNSHCADAYWRRGNIYGTDALHNQYLKAISDLTQSIRIDSLQNGGVAYWDRAYMKWEMNDSVGALTDYNLAIAVNPTKENYYYYRARLKYTVFKDTLGALQDLNSAILNWNQYDLARQFRAEIYVIQGKYADAMNDYNHLHYIVQSEFTYNAPVFYYRAVAKYETGNFMDACNDITLANQLGFPNATQKMKLFCRH